jgi:tight adherence protein B
MDIFSIITQLLGQTGMMLLIGVVIFLFSFKYSINIFEWIENQTYGTRNYILEQLEMLHLTVKPQYITYLLLFLSFGNSIILLLICGTFSKWGLGIVLAVLMALLGWKIPKPFVNYLVTRRINAYQSQMVDALQLISNGLRAGQSVQQSLSMVVTEMNPPISQEFNTILQQARIGQPLEECFEDLVKRVPLEDNQMFVSSVNILKETGGNLAEVFDTIVGVIRERVRLLQKIKTLTAQAMMQAFTIAAMPYGLLLVFCISDFKTMKPLFTHPLGLAALFAVVFLDSLGLWVIMKIIKIKA